MSSDPNETRRRVHSLYFSFLERKIDGDADATLGELVAEHPDLADELLQVHGRCEVALELLEDVSASDAPSASEQLAEALSRERDFPSRYRVEGEIARGGMGVILAVEDRHLRRELAMKMLGETSMGDEADPEVRVFLERARARLLDEAQITGQLDHPGVAPVHELGVDPDGRIYFTMARIRGHNFEEIIERVHGDEDGWHVTRALSVLLRVCETMCFAHSKGVLHRDLKPANVMVGPYGETYVMDWGLAKLVDHENRGPDREAVDVNRPLRSVRRDDSDSGDSPLLTGAGEIVGTPLFMAPEQARGEPVDERSDVFCVGAMLYHLLAGSRPYADLAQGKTPSEVISIVRARAPTALEHLRGDVPEELSAICSKAMRREATDRYASMAELRDDVRAYLEGRVVRAHRTGALAELRKWTQRNRGLAAATLASIALAISMLAGFTYIQSVNNERLRRKNDQLDASRRVATDRAAEVTRLADIKRLRDLDERDRALWPATPAAIADMRRWITDARTVMGRLELHRATLRELRTKATSGPDDGAPGASWKFATFEESWEHDALVELITLLEPYASEPSEPIEAMERRIRFAGTIHERSVSGPRATNAWRQAIHSVASGPHYDGFELEPQLGLLPIGPDPTTGLQEFAHLQSGEIPERHPTTGELQFGPDSCIVLVLLPGGTFWMGSQSVDPSQPNFTTHAGDDESPVHSITLAPFFLSKFEMTQGQWLRFTGENPSHWSLEKRTVRGEAKRTLALPVEMVSWSACYDVTRKLGLTLPTEAQWEYAARAHTTTAWWTGEDRETLAGNANILDRTFVAAGGQSARIAEWPEFDDGFPIVAEVHRLGANPFGLHHVHGNVYEWCLDARGAYTDPVSPGTGAREPSRPIGRNTRGGSFFDSALGGRCGNRHVQPETTTGDDLGLRPARALSGSR